MSARRKRPQFAFVSKPLSQSALIHIGAALVLWLALWPSHHAFKRPRVSASIGIIDVSGMNTEGKAGVAHSEARRDVKAGRVAPPLEGEISRAAPQRMVVSREDAPQTGSIAQVRLGGGETSEFQAYLRELVKRVESKKIYPDDALSREEEGTVTLTITVDPDGSIVETKLTEASRYPALNQAALETIRRVGRVAPLPEGYSRIRLQIPMVFQIYGL